MTTLEVIPSDVEASALLDKIEMARCLSLLAPNNIMPTQLRLNVNDTYYSVARKIVKAYIRQVFPSSENPQVLTRYIKMEMIPIHSRICVALYGYQGREEVTLLRFIEPIRAALETFHQTLQANRNYLYVQCNSSNATFFVRASSDDFIYKRGSLKEYVASMLTAIRTTKEALDAVVLAIGDFDETIARCTAIKAEQDEQERLRQSNAVADICTKITGVGYGPFDTASTATTPPQTERVAPWVIQRAAETTNVAPQAETATILTGRIIRESLAQLRGTLEPTAHLDGLTADSIIMDEITVMPDNMDAPADAPRMTDMNGNVVRPAEPELQARLNQILREQGVVI